LLTTSRIDVMTADTTVSPSGAEPRALVLLKSRRRLDWDPHAWTDDDLAARGEKKPKVSHPSSCAQREVRGHDTI
jgi:hypothetical protein